MEISMRTIQAEQLHDMHNIPHINSTHCMPHTAHPTISPSNAPGALPQVLRSTMIEEKFGNEDRQIPMVRMRDIS